MTSQFKALESKCPKVPLRIFKSLLSDIPQFTSVAQQCLTLWSHGLLHARTPCPSPTPRDYSNSCPSSQWCHPTISSSVISFSSCLQSFPASGSISMSHFFASGGKTIGVTASASVLPMNIQDWFPLGGTGWISLQSKGHSRVFSNTTVQRYPPGKWCYSYDFRQMILGRWFQH